MYDNLLVSADFSDEDDGVVIVGRRMETGGIAIVNVLLGDDAKELYEFLTRVRNRHVH